MRVISVIFVSMMLVLCSTLSVLKLDSKENWDVKEKEEFLKTVSEVIPILELEVDTILDMDVEEITFEEFSEIFKENSYGEMIGKLADEKFIRRYWDLFSSKKNSMTRGDFYFFISLYESEAYLITAKNHPKLTEKGIEGEYTDLKLGSLIDKLFKVSVEEANWTFSKIVNGKKTDTIDNFELKKLLKDEWEKELQNEGVDAKKIRLLTDFGHKLAKFNDWKGNNLINLKTLKMFMHAYLFRVGHLIVQARKKKNANNKVKAK